MYVCGVWYMCFVIAVVDKDVCICCFNESQTFKAVSRWSADITAGCPTHSVMCSAVKLQGVAGQGVPLTVLCVVQ